MIAPLNQKNIKRKVQILLGAKISGALGKATLRFNRVIRIIKVISLAELFHYVKSDEKSLIIETEYGGLGDNLFYTPIARIAKESKKYDKVFFSNVSPFRRKEHKEFIWGLNPYIDGFINLPGKLCSNLPADQNTKSLIKARETNIIDLILKNYDLSARAQMTSPEIFYIPRNISKYNKKILFDPNWVTDLYDAHHVYKQIESYFYRNKIHIDFQFPPSNGRSGLTNATVKTIKDAHFSEYCDLIGSFGEFYCFASGSAVLAESLGVKANVFYTDEMNDIFIYSNMHNYIKLDRRNYG